MISHKQKVILFLMTQKGFEVLRGLIDNGLKKAIAQVVIGKDKNVINDYANEIEYLCIKENINFIYRENFIVKNNSEYLIAISWRWLIQSNKKLIVLHDSILPKYRGFAPLVNMLINGEKQLGVTALYAENDYDKGPIIEQEIIDINYPMLIADAINIISKLYISICVTIIKKIYKRQVLVSTKQVEEQASYSLWRDEEDYIINWHNDATSICRFINALGYPYRGAKCWIEDKEIIIQKAIQVETIKIENRTVGKVIFIDENGRPTVVCGTGLIKIIEAKYLHNSVSIIPLKQFRLRFSSK